MDDELGMILFVADVLEPVDVLSVHFLLDGDVRHRGGRRSAVPVLFPRRAEDNIARADFLDRSSPALHAAASRRHGERLTGRVGVPSTARARFERYVGSCEIERPALLKLNVSLKLMRSRLMATRVRGALIRGKARQRPAHRNLNGSCVARAR